MNHTLIEALLYLAAGIEFSDEKKVDPDWAAARLELLADTLQQLSPTDRKEFGVAVEELASDCESVPEDAEFVQFLRSFMEEYGLNED